MFHIGHEMVECLMRTPNPVETKSDSPKEQTLESRVQHSPVRRHWWIVDTVVWPFFLSLRWLLQSEIFFKRRSVFKSIHERH